MLYKEFETNYLVTRKVSTFCHTAIPPVEQMLIIGAYFMCILVTHWFSALYTFKGFGYILFLPPLAF